MTKIKNLISRNKLLFAILFIALFLRLLGVWHGYPFSYYADETTFVKRALAFGSFDFNPHWFHKPAFYMYILFFEYGLYFLIGKLIGLWDTTTDLAVSYIINPGPFYLIGRLTTVFFSMATVVVVYLTGEKHFTKNTGLAGALLLALSFGHVVASQDVKADVPATFFAILAMFFLLNYIKDLKSASLLLAAAAVGMGTATKFYPVVVLIPIVTAILIVCAKEKNKYFPINAFKWIIAALAVFCLTYFLCSPYDFLDPLGRQDSVFGRLFMFSEKVLSFFSESVEVTKTSIDFIGQRMSVLEGFSDYLQKLLNQRGMGLLIGGVSLSGIIYLLARFKAENLLLISFPILFALISILDSPGYADTRHQIPIYPFLAISGAALVVFIAGKNRIQQLTVYGLLLAGLCIPFITIIQHGITISKEDTRNIARQWIEMNIPPGEKILLIEGGPQLLMSEKNLLQSLDMVENDHSTGQFTAHYDKYLNYQLLAAQKSITYDIAEIRFPWWVESEKDVGAGAKYLTSELDKDMGNPLRKMGINSYQFYLNNGYKYAIVQSNRYWRYFSPDANKIHDFPSFKQFYTDLFNHGKLIKEFSPDNGDRPGPVVRIYEFTEKVHRPESG